jgi:glycosyltransferase involved in cell wall biosynthesis
VLEGFETGGHEEVNTRDRPALPIGETRSHYTLRSMPGVTVIVPARDAEATIGRTLAGLEAQQGDGGFEVVVVDDGSRDATAQIARSSPVVTTVVEGGGAGPARARNAGAERASGERLAFLDSDCEPTPGWLAAGAGALDDAVLVQGEVRPRPESPAGPFDRTLSVTAAWGLFESANLFLRRETFEAVGGFQSWLSPRRGIELGEDVWLGWRVRRSGAPTGFCADALAYHEVFPRSARAYVAERARLRFFPAMAARIPELREDFFWRLLFLNRRSALFDLAVAGTLAAAARRSPLPLLAAAPYAREAYRHARRAGTARRLPAVAAADVAADAVGAAALIAGSVRARSLLG